MTEFGFQPFPDPAPYHGPLSVEWQNEMFARPGEYMVEWDQTGRARIILTGEVERLRPYVDAIVALYLDEN